MSAISMKGFPTNGSSDSIAFTPSKKVKRAPKESFCDAKVAAFISIGVLTLVYVIAELAAGIYVDSLVLLSDGFHNLSDVISLYIAYWAQQAQKRELTDSMSYGWGRSEIIGGLTNGCFLLAICLYVVLESIPKFIEPKPISAGLVFIFIAAVGLVVNFIGTMVFCFTGQGHSHSHGGGGHSHGHSHGHGHKDKKKKKEGHGHSHGHKENGKDHGKDNGDTESLLIKEKKEKKHKEKKEGHGHGHSHDHKEKKKKKQDLNVHAVFLHYLGDTISSLMVLGSGIFIHFFKGQKWTEYIDPVSSLLIIGLILWTTIPLVKRCSMILLQSTPTEIELEKVRHKLIKIEGLLNIHDFHVWQLVDGMVIASIHISIEEGVDFTHLVADVKRIFHEFGIHSSTIQPEFVPRSFQSREAGFCEQNCVKECNEDWCCKKSADAKRAQVEEFSIETDV